MLRKYGRISLTERWHVKGYIPPENLADIAEERTTGFQSAFVHYGARAQDIGPFARSCYMQGVNDATDALAKNCEPLKLKAEACAKEPK